MHQYISFVRQTGNGVKVWTSLIVLQQYPGRFCNVLQLSYAISTSVIQAGSMKQQATHTTAEAA